ncbi:branched-chain amino acid aminotransferase [Paenibacillus filicis]|uniref:branched-chain-amino-acid transaminase n=1 Tax=Paenibacillus gyeongsangnamensis TaxID=3388067 RepID=A0ABT4Q5R8_9BACL|nr:branched-chain amino acid aminotransferase [Paenibacillus filicis]MCZ8512137.1 branched-chain amino acid aminotransferase [Paenibacillus filicis]
MEDRIEISLSTCKKLKPEPDRLGFGKAFTDHMFIMDYAPETGWHRPRIIPYQPIQLDPAAKVFHYGQTVFEGMKAYRTREDRILLFRPGKHFQRLNRSNERLCIPPVREELALEALKQLLLIDRDWIPAEEGTSLYIRPFIIATEPLLGVAPSNHYQFIIILSQVGAYYAEGIRPVKIMVEADYVRAVNGGVGSAKTAGNYAAGLKAQETASGLGYAQVLWLDGVQRRNIEEVGSMNVFFKLNGKLVTPYLSGSILDGTIRDSILHLLKHWEIPVEERIVTIDELVVAFRHGGFEEAFGTGTAAVISPIGELYWQGERLLIGKGDTGELTRRLYDTLTGIQYGRLADPFGWTVEVAE